MKNDIFWSIARTLILGVIAFFLGMQYWSSNLIEERLIQIQKKIEEVQSSTDQWKGQPLGAGTNRPIKASEETKESSPFPNLLVDDPFYEKTLPILLGPEYRPFPLRFLATISKPENLHPFSNWYQSSIGYSFCVGNAAKSKTGFYEVYCPFLAERIEERLHPDGKGSAYWIFLRKDIFWKGLRPSLFPSNIQLAPHFLKPWPVTAHDFKFYYDVAMNPFNQEAAAIITRQYYDDVVEFKVIDDSTFVVEWKTKEFVGPEGKSVYKHKYRAKQLTLGLTPLPRFVYQYYPDGTKIVEDSDPETYRTNSSFVQIFTDHWAKNYIVSNGAYEFYGMDDSGMRFLKNPQFYNPYFSLYGEVEMAFRNSQDSIWSDFKLGTMSTYELPSFQLPEYERFLDSQAYAEQKKNGRAIRRLDYLQRVFTYIGWNENRPLFASKKVRQALTYAIDRNRIIREILNGQAVPITGPFFKESPNSNPHLLPYPFDPAKAKVLLKEEGWKDLNGDGVLKKEIDGKVIPFRFSLIYYVKSTVGRAITDFIATQLKAVGIECEPKGIDTADLSAKADDKDFDALILSWVLSSPPEDPKQIWSSKVKDIKGSSNFIGFGNARVDKIIEELEYESDPEKRRELAFEFEAILYDEQPYTFLFTPIAVLLYRENVHNVFIPKYRQDLIPGADVTEPLSSLFFEK